MLITKENTLVIVPALNEQDSVVDVLNELREFGFHVLVVSDGSTDDTATQSRAAGATVLELPINLGVGGALRAGFQHAVSRGYEAIVQVDADGQHPPNEIINLITAANESGAHMVVGSRFISHDTTMSVGTSRRLVMRVLAWSASRATHTVITDATSGFRLIRMPLLGEFAQSFAVNYLGDTYEALVSAGRGGYKIREIPAGLRPRQMGESSASIAQSVRFTLKGIGIAMLHIHFPISSLQDVMKSRSS